MINDRIQLIINQLFEGNASKFSRIVGISSGKLSNYLGDVRKSMPAFDVIERIYKAIEGINPEWLLTGEGEWKLDRSLKEDNQLVTYLSKKLDEKNVRIEQLSRQLGEQDKENQILHERIMKLELLLSKQKYEMLVADKIEPYEKTNNKRDSDKGSE